MQRRLTSMFAFEWDIDITDENPMAYPHPDWLVRVCFNLGVNSKA